MEARADTMFWLRPGSAEDAAIVRRLQVRYTYVNPAFSGAQEQGASTKGIEPEFLLWQERDGWVGFPRTAALQTAYKEGWDFADGRTDGRSLRAGEQVLQFRRGQGEGVADVIRALSTGANGTTLQADCGWGKTSASTEVIRRIGCSTAVLVHKNFLAKQWEEELQQFIPGVRVGRIQGDRLDTGYTHDVVVCMIQSLLERNYPAEVYQSFGLVVADESHRHAAFSWSKAASLFPARYRLALTATPDRRDGLSVVFLSNFGEICHRGRADRMAPRLEVRFTPTVVDRRLYYMWRGGQQKPNMPKLINALVANQARTEMILKDVRAACEKGRRPIVLSHRLEHVAQMIEVLRSIDIDARALIGGMDEDAQMAACEGDVVVGTYAMAQEGLDVPDLDTLFLTTPQGQVEQACGRILRTRPDKRQPMVVDYVDRSVGICMGLFRSRSKTYAKLGAERRVE